MLSFRFSLAIPILVTLFLIPSKAAAINNACKNPNQYEVTMSVQPSGGGKDFEVTIEGTFKWTTTNTVCLNNKLLFDLSYEYKTSGLEQIVEEKFGAIQRDQLVRFSKVIRPVDLLAVGNDPTLKNGDVVTFILNIESDDVSDFGDDLLLSPPRRPYTLSTNPTVTPTRNPGFTPGPSGRPVTLDFEIRNPLKINSFLELFAKITEWLTNIAIPIAVILIVYAGVLFLTGGAYPANVSKARSILLYVVIGLSIILIGRGFITLIESVLNLGNETPSQTATPSTSPSTTTIPVGGLGDDCDAQTGCTTPFICGNSNICQRSTGNTRGEPCYADANCGSGLSCVGANVGREELGTCQ